MTYIHLVVLIYGFPEVSARNTSYCGASRKTNEAKQLSNHGNNRRDEPTNNFILLAGWYQQLFS